MCELSDASPTPLDDLRVVEISDRIAGAYCGKLFVDAGADVVKVEPASGDPLRRFTATGAAPAEGSRCTAVQLPQCREAQRDKPLPTICSQRADVVIVTATRSEAIAWASTRSDCWTRRRGRVVVTISDFGWTGPWSERAATEFTLQAWSGLTGFRGDPAGPPISIGGELGEYMGGACAAYGALALRRRVRRGGPGGHLDMSMLEAITLMQSCEWLHSQLLNVPPIRRSVEVPSIEQATDGYVGISMVTGQQWLDFAAMVDCHELTEIPDLRFQIGRWDTATGSVSGSGRGCASAPSPRSSNSASCSGCPSPRWATARRSRRWITCASAASMSTTPPAFGSRAHRG